MTHDAADSVWSQALHVFCTVDLDHQQFVSSNIGLYVVFSCPVWSGPEHCLSFAIGLSQISVHDLDWTVPTAVILGNESRLPPLARSCCVFVVAVDVGDVGLSFIWSTGAPVMKQFCPLTYDAVFLL